ncbi:MAG TPA: ferric reductase-like transmembrane domain-containing protein, partial [Solirubrobacteraceae bacterium]|nr:ferric reductase-like transmembrane domain-containing protein [Solirubrobacteraceae bacterium]
MHLTSSPVDWYVARAGGVVAYVLLTLTVLLGLTMSSRRRSQRWPRMAVEDVHRFAGILVGVFVVVHVVAVAIDSYLPFSPAAIVVPFVSAYRPAWVALGIVAAELLLALAVTNRLRHRSLSYETWRRVHYLNFAVWGGATLHGLGSGTDRSTPWMVAVYACGSAAVAAFTAFRVLRRRPLAPRVRAAASPGVAALAAAAVLVLALGPLRPHARPWNA